MSKNNESIINRTNPAERAWLRSLGCTPKARKSGKVTERVMTDTEAHAYGVDLKRVRSERAKRAAAARRANAERAAVAETVEHIAETGQAVAW